jgi:pimeloyl-ACP methyl ester carboxylesterase
MKPDDFHHHYAQVNGIRMHYVRAGHDDRLVLLLHGFPENWYSWRHQIGVLAEHATVIAPDMRGYNETEKPRDGYELNILAEDIAQLIRVVGFRRCALVGHDWGGAIAWSLAISRPDLIERLAVLNAPHPGTFGLGAKISLAQLRRSWYIAFFQLPWLPELLLRSGDYRFIKAGMRRDGLGPDRVSEAEMHFFRQAMARPGALHAAINYYRRGLLHTGGIFKGTGLQVKMPTTLIWGEQDAYLGTELIDGIQRFVPQLQIKRIADCSHWVQQHRPDLVNQYLQEWLLHEPQEVHQ